MTIRTRLEDAIALWQAGHREGAWVMVLIAAAATSRLRFPRDRVKQDREAFIRFIREVTPTIVDPSRAPVGPPGITMVLRADTPNPVPLHEVLYEHFRCHLVHEGKLHPQVRLSTSRFAPGTPVMEFPDAWVWNLAKAVQDAPENAALFRTDKPFR